MEGKKCISERLFYYLEKFTTNAVLTSHFSLELKVSFVLEKEKEKEC